ncbi:MAG TPA: hypothetical protein VMS55_01745 [Myxococcota bacterium]|nr:hypothetical protein [Myxococcota bacterium]
MFIAGDKVLIFKYLAGSQDDEAEFNRAADELVGVLELEADRDGHSLIAIMAVVGGVQSGPGYVTKQFGIVYRKAADGTWPKSVRKQ